MLGMSRSSLANGTRRAPSDRDCPGEPKASHVKHHVWLYYMGVHTKSRAALVQHRTSCSRCRRLIVRSVVAWPRARARAHARARERTVEPCVVRLCVPLVFSILRRLIVHRSELLPSAGRRKQTRHTVATEQRRVATQSDGGPGGVAGARGHGTGG